MKKRTITLLSLLVIVVLVACACGQQAPPAASPAAPAESQPAATPATSEPAADDNVTEGGITLTDNSYDLIYATNTAGTGQYTIAAAQASIVTSTTGRVNVTVLPCASSEGIAAAYMSGQANIGQQAYGTMNHIWTDPANPPINMMRSIFGGGVLPFTFIVNADSGIKSVSDLAGKRVTYLSANYVYNVSAESILFAYDLDPKTDIKALPMTDSSGAMQDLVDGRTDAVLTSISGSKMTDLASKITPFALPMDVDKMQKAIDYSEQYLVPHLLEREFPGVPPGSHYVGTLQQVNAKVDVPDEAVYLFTKVVMEGYDELSQVAPDLVEWSAKAAIRPEVGFPYHAGAVAYYKEAGLWTDEIDAWQKSVLAELGVDR